MPSYSYSGDPSRSALDKVRFELGDTDSSEWMLTDEEITAVLGDYPDPIAAAVQICEGPIVARFSRLVDVTLDGGMKALYSQRAAAFRALASSLKAKLGRLAAPWAGNYDPTWQQAVATDAGIVQPQFTVGMHDNPGTTNDHLASGNPFVEVVPG